MKNISILTKVFLSVKSPADMSNLLEGLLTPKEIIELVQRLEIVKRLKSGQPQHQIAEELGVGVATVTRGSREIQRGKFAYV